MSFLDGLFGGKPPKYDKLDSLLQLLDRSRSGDEIGDNLGTTAEGIGNLWDFIEARMAGEDILSDEDYAHIIAPLLAQSSQDAANASFMADERASALNMNPRNGSLARTHADIGRAHLDANRRGHGQLAVQRAGVRNSNAMQGMSALQALLEGDQQFRGGENTKEYNAAAARATASSGLGNALKFAAGVVGGLYGAPGGFSSAAGVGNAAPSLVDTYQASPTQWGGSGAGQPLPSAFGFDTSLGSAFPSFAGDESYSNLGSAFDRALGTSRAPIFATR